MRGTAGLAAPRRLTPLRTTFSMTTKLAYVPAGVEASLSACCLVSPLYVLDCRLLVWVTACVGRTRAQREAWIRTLLSVSQRSKRGRTVTQHAAFLYRDCPPPSEGNHVLFVRVVLSSSQQAKMRSVALVYPLLWQNTETTPRFSAIDCSTPFY